MVLSKRYLRRVLTAVIAVFAAISLGAGEASALWYTGTGNYEYWWSDGLVSCGTERDMSVGVASKMAFNDAPSLGLQILTPTVHYFHWEFDWARGSNRWVYYPALDVAIDSLVLMDGDNWQSFSSDAYQQPLPRAGAWSATIEMTWSRMIGWNQYVTGSGTFDVNVASDYTGTARGNGDYCFFS